MPGDDYKIHHVLYVSRCRHGPYDVADIEILRVSLRNNEAHRITGFLHREGGFYLQWFEGEKDAVETLRRRLMKDPRHFDVRVIEAGTLPERQFDGFSMGYSTGQASSLGLTEQQVDKNLLRAEDLLRFLREVSRQQRERGDPAT